MAEPTPPAALRILITGASGSGTTTLAAALATALGGRQVDADDHYWLPTSPPYREKRDPVLRRARLAAELAGAGPVAVSGSVMGWGAEIEEGFDLIVFLTLATPIRLERLRARELRQLGRLDADFLAWAAQYDEGPPMGRSLAKHRAWLAQRHCPVLALDGDLTVSERLEAVRRALQDLPVRPVHAAPDNASGRA